MVSSQGIWTLRGAILRRRIGRPLPLVRQAFQAAIFSARQRKQVVAVAAMVFAALAPTP
jgi:hypothetical protein